MVMFGLSFLTLSRCRTTESRRLMINPILCVTIFVIVVVWFVLRRVARLMSDTSSFDADRVDRVDHYPNGLRVYFRDIGSFVIDGAGRKAHDSPAACFEYFCVPAYG